ncbi:MAG: hypothetical protein U5K43_14015 [Halofilum sp. (in: g-proteobacteria)]|nr:hypothetical protein [Halofilum sp. (in: g-proteobacteria)]
MAGRVMAPVDATLAEAEPEIEPNSAEDSTDTLAAPPLQAARPPPWRRS